MATYSQSKRLIQSTYKNGSKAVLIKAVDIIPTRVRVRFKLASNTRWLIHPLKAFVLLFCVK